MVGRKNQQLMQRRGRDQAQRFGLRKLAIGVVSVLLGTTIFLTGPSAMADTTATSTATTTAITSAATSTATSASSSATSSATSSTSSTSAASTASSASSDSSSASSTTTSASAASSSVSAASSSTTVTALAATTSTTTSDSSSTTTSDSSDSTSDSSATTISNYTETTDTVNASTTATKVTDSNGSSLAVSQNTVGNDGNTNSVTVTFSLSAKAGDVYTITIPTSNAYYLSVGTDGSLSSSYGTTSVDETVSGQVTYTYTFSVAASLTLYLYLNETNSYQKQSETPMTDPTGTYAKVITWTTTRDGVTTTNPELVLWQTISPTMSPTAVTRITPSSSSGITKVLPNVEYTYQFSLNETDGLEGTYASGQANSAVNLGTTIDIPVPAGFTLDETRSLLLSEITDDTTITQPGGTGTDIIITVPKGSGSQNYLGKSYKLVGSFDTTQSTSDTVISAADNPLASNDGKVTITQTVATTSGTTTLTATADAWTETIAGTVPPDTEGEFSAIALANNSAAELLLDSDDTDNPAIVNYFTVTNSTAYALTDATFYLNFADGLDVTGIKTPVSDTTMPGTTSYTYTLTLTDGSTVTGTVTAGETVTDTRGSAGLLG